MPKEHNAIIKFGNSAAHEVTIERTEDATGETVENRIVTPRHEEIGPTITKVELPYDGHDHGDKLGEATTLTENAKTITDGIDERGIVGFISLHVQNARLPWEIACGHMLSVMSNHAGGRLDWVDCSDKKLQGVLAALFDCEEGEQLGYGQEELPPLAGGDPLLDEIVGLAKDEMLRWPTLLDRLREAGDPLALKTNAGVDFIASNCFGEAASAAQLNYFALTANNTAVSASNTALEGEITTSEGGLIRKKATYAHTNGTTTATLTVTFTANNKDSLAVTVNKFGIFNKSVSGGTMGIETKPTAVTFNAENDNATITETLTIT